MNNIAQLPTRSFADLLHALKTPLNHIIGLSELLKDVAEEDELRTLFPPLSLLSQSGQELSDMTAQPWIQNVAQTVQPGYLSLATAARPTVALVIKVAQMLMADPLVDGKAPFLDYLPVITNAAEKYLALAESSALIRAK